jgi:hypothetical protein
MKRLIAKHARSTEKTFFFSAIFAVSAVKAQPHRCSSYRD